MNTQMTKKDIYIGKQWQASTLNWNGNTPILSHQYDYPFDLIFIDKTVDKIAHTKNDLFVVVEYNTIKKPRIQTTALGKDFIRCTKKDLYGISRFYKLNKLSPYLELLAKHFYKYYGVISVIHVNRPLDPESAQALNAMVEDIRREAKNMKFRKMVDNEKRSSRKNTASLIEYIRTLHRAYSKLVVVRLELGYSVEYRKSFNFNDLDPLQVKQDFFKLLRLTSRKFPSRVGYIWKLEYGRTKSYHFHLMFFFDGHEARQDITLAQLIGEHWVKDATNGKGTYWNINARKEMYAKLGLLGIGTIRYNDFELRRNLEKAATYLTKVDYYVRLNVPGIDRVFGKGKCPRIEKVRRGRPRTHITD